MVRIEDLGINPYIYSHLLLMKVFKATLEENSISLTNGFWYTRFPHGGEYNWTRTSCSAINLFKGVKDLNLKYETLKVLEENILRI